MLCNDSGNDCSVLELSLTSWVVSLTYLHGLCPLISSLKHLTAYSVVTIN